jgi:GT2 family glycosyltransferase
MAGVCALILTRDRRRLLAECLDSVLAQHHPVAELIVFDNASADDTPSWLAERARTQPGLRSVRSERNLGGAGGYAELIRLGSETDAEWLWLLDDDAEPRPDALAKLLATPLAGDAGVVALGSAVVHPNGEVDPLHRCRLGQFVTPLPAACYAPGTRAEVDCASFVGLLVRTQAARDAGLPQGRYFLGYDDAEYSLRLRRLGRVVLVPESVVVHKLPVGGGQLTRRSRMWNRLLGLSYTSAPWESYWKDLYRVRNAVALKVEHQRISQLQLLVVVLGYVAKTLLYDNRPLRRIPWIVRFAWRGWRGDFRAPAPEQWPPRQSAGSSGR